MIYRKYKTFNEAFYSFNREIIENTEEVLSYRLGHMGGINNIFMQIDSPQCDKIDLGSLGYKSGKWRHLIGTYLGKEKILELKRLGTTTKGLSTGFDFLRKKTGNGACLREIIISRERRNSPWTSITIVWRTSELSRKWGADLVLISKIMEVIPNSDFKTINFHLDSAYQPTNYVVPFLGPVFGIDFKELDPKVDHHKAILHSWKTLFAAEIPPHKFLASEQRLIDFYKGGNQYTPIDSKDLKL